MRAFWLPMCFLGLVVAAGDLILLAELPSPHWFVDGLILLVTIYVTLWYASRIWLVRTFLRRSGGNPDKSVEEVVSLATQDKAIEELTLLLQPPASLDGRLVSLKAPWGGGKTVLLRRFEHALRECSRGTHIPVWINVWQAETETDLHRALYEEILFTPEIFRECWLALPWMAPRFGPLLRGMLRSVRVAFKNGGLEAEATLQADEPLRLTVQPQIRWIVTRLQDCGRTPVIILEEIDRATPAMGRAVVVAAQRSLLLPGVTVVLPYVQEHLWHKVFDPLDIAPPDLDSTLDTLLFDDMVQSEALPNEAAARRADIPSAEELGLLAAKPVPQTQERAARPLDPRAPLAVWQRYQLHRYFAGLSNVRRRRLTRRFAEKYLGASQVEMQRYSAADIALLITEKVSLWKLTEAVFPALNQLGAKDELRKFVQMRNSNLRIGQLRHFEHYYMRLLENRPGEIATIAAGNCPAPPDFWVEQWRDAAKDDPEAMANLDARIEAMWDAKWTFDTAARTVAALVALAAWYADRLMLEGKT